MLHTALGSSAKVASPTAADYDLGAVNASPGGHNRRRIRWVFLVLFTAAAGSTFYLATALTLSHRWSVEAAIGEVLAILISSVFGFLWSSFARVPVSIEVNPQGVDLLFGNGKRSAISWASFGAGARLAWTAGSPDLLSRGAPSYVITGTRPAQILLTREAFDGIFRVGRAQGYKPEETLSGRGYTTIALRPA
jgi:hypothetical protein